MKRIISVISVMVMLLTIIMPISVYAKNGPYKSSSENDSTMAIISFVDVQSSGEVSYVYPFDLCKGGKYYNSKNITYNEATNTLTLDNFKTETIMVLTAMGDDFKIKLSGYNELGCIISSDLNWGSSVTVTGKGVLVVNKNRTFTDAVFVDGSGTGYAFFKAENTVGLKLLKGSDSAVGVYGVETDASGKAIILQGKVTGNTVTANKYVKNTYEQTSVYYVDHYTGDGIFCEKTGAGNENKIFVAEITDSEKELYNVAEVVFDNELKKYIILPVNDGSKNILLKENGYVDLSEAKYPSDDVLVISSYLAQMNLCVDENGKECVFVDYSENSKPETDVEVYEIFSHSKYGKLGLLYAPKKTYKELKRVKSTTVYDYISKSGDIVVNSTPESVPAAVKIKSVANAFGGVNVKWNGVSGAEEYVVYRKTLANNKWSGWQVVGTVNSTEYLDKGVKNGTQYRYTVRAKNILGLGGFEKDGRLVAYVEAPTTTISNSLNGVKVSWSKVAGATGYRVYRSQYSGGKWSGWKNMGTANIQKAYWVDRSVESGVTYRYTVRALSNKLISSFKATEGLMFLSAPTVKAVNSSNGVNVTWTKVNGALNYTVYRSNIVSGKWSSWKKLTTTGAVTGFTDVTANSGAYYKYTVRAVNGKSTGAYKASSQLFYLAQPTVKISNATNGIKVSWTKCAGATGYTVYRSQLLNGKWSGWKTMGTAKADKSAWVDKGVKTGAQYKYTVRAVNGKLKSSFTATAPLVSLTAPTVKIANSTTGVKITFNKVTGANSYVLYRSELVGGKWSSWKNLGKIGNVNSYIDASAVSGVTYRYTARAVNGASLSPYKATAQLLYLTAPRVTLAEGEGGLVLSWNASAGAKEYIVYRAEYDAKTKKFSSWSVLSSNSVTPTYTDTTAVKGKTYRYTVRAVSDKTKSAYISSADVIKK